MMWNIKNMMRIKALIQKCLVVCGLFVISGVTAHAASYLEIDADPGEFLFGSDITVTDADGSLDLHFTAPNQLSGGFTWRGATAKSNIQLTFFSGSKQPMQVGSYLNAVGPGWMAGQIDPALNVYLISAGRACIPNAGEFFVYEFEPQATPPRYAINFTQDCLYANQAKIHGILRINSNYPKYDPNPVAAISSTSLNAIEGGDYQLSAEQSRSQNSDIVSYRWSQLYGPTVKFANDKAKVTSIKLPVGLVLGGETVDLQLTVTNAEGYSNSTVLKLHVASKSDPRSYFRLATGAQFPNEVSAWDVNIEDEDLIIVKGGRTGINATIGTSTASPNDYSLTMGPVASQDFVAGFYSNARRYIDGNPVLDFSGFSHGCNQVFGSFEVLDLQSEYDELARYHARFTHYCESPNAVPTSGEIAFNVLDPNVPTIKVQIPASVVEGQTITLDASASVDKIGNIVSYEWFELHDVSIKNRDRAIATAVAPLLKNGNPPYLFFSLYITDNEGFQASKLVPVKLLPNTKSSSSASVSSVSAGATSGSSGGGGAVGSWYYLLFVFLLMMKQKNKIAISTMVALVNAKPRNAGRLKITVIVNGACKKIPC